MSRSDFDRDRLDDEEAQAQVEPEIEGVEPGDEALDGEPEEMDASGDEPAASPHVPFRSGPGEDGDDAEFQ